MRILYIIILLNLSTLTQGQEKTSSNYFYTGKKYGSEAMFNPWNHILNEGFDIIQLQNKEQSRYIFDQNYTSGFNSVFKSIIHPFKTVSAYGWNDFISNEIFPIKFSDINVSWIPNYALHLVGGGASYAIMKEYYAYHHFKNPQVWSGITIMSAHILNEVIESEYTNEATAASVADIFIFDLGGILLYSFDPVKRLAGKTLNVRDWSPQPSLLLTNYSLINNGKYYSAKLPLRFSKKLSLFAHWGIGTMLGGSYKLKNDESISLSAGTIMSQVIEDGKNLSYAATWRAGIFYDRNSSLLGSIIFNGNDENFCNINVYPGVVRIKKFSPGLWSVISRQGNVSLGFSTRFSIGLGVN